MLKLEKAHYGKPDYIDSPTSTGFIRTEVGISFNDIIILRDKGIITQYKVRGSVPYYYISSKDELRISLSSSDSPQSPRFLDTILSLEDEATFDEIASQHDIFDYMSTHMAPLLVGKFDEKKAALTLLISDDDSHGDKNRIHMLLWGKAGTGKSELLMFIKKKFQAIYVDGSRASKPDLTINKTSGEPGYLIRAHNWIIAIEEADKMEKSAWGSCLTAMGEQGMFEVAHTEYPAAVRAICTANVISDWPEEVLSRFTYIIRYNRPNKNELQDILAYRYKYYNLPKPDSESDLIVKYVAWARKHKPEIEDIDEINEIMKNNIDSIGDVRAGLDIMRISIALAKAYHSNVNSTIYKKALDLYNSLNNTNLNEEE